MAVTVTEPTGAVSGNWVFATVKGTHQEVVDWISQTGKASQGFFIYGFTSDQTNATALVGYIKP